MRNLILAVVAVLCFQTLTVEGILGVTKGVGDTVGKVADVACDTLLSTIKVATSPFLNLLNKIAGNSSIPMTDIQNKVTKPILTTIRDFQSKKDSLLKSKITKFVSTLAAKSDFTNQQINKLINQSTSLKTLLAGLSLVKVACNKELKKGKGCASGLNTLVCFLSDFPDLADGSIKQLQKIKIAFADFFKYAKANNNKFTRTFTIKKILSKIENSYH